MAQTMRKIGVYLGLVEDDPMAPEYDYPSYDVSDSARAGSAPRGSVDDRPATSGMAAKPTSVSVATIAESTPETTSIHTIEPRNYNDARRIGEEFRNGSPVIVNLTDMGESEAKRIVDFAAGLVFGVHGSIEKVTNRVFLLSPQNVDVRDAPAVQQARDGFFNQS